MARLTYQDADGWGLHGVSWDQLAALPPRVYGALVRLRDLEARMEAEPGRPRQRWRREERRHGSSRDLRA